MQIRETLARLAPKSIKEKIAIRTVTMDAFTSLAEKQGTIIVHPKLKKEPGSIAVPAFYPAAAYMTAERAIIVYIAEPYEGRKVFYKKNVPEKEAGDIIEKDMLAIRKKLTTLA